MLLPVFLWGIAGCSDAGLPAGSNGAPAHHTADGFRNPHVEPQKRGFFRYLKMRYFGGEDYADYQASAGKVRPVEPDRRQIHHPGNLPQVTWIGHATLLIQYRGRTILTDPMFSDRASPVTFAGPKRVNPPALNIGDLPAIDYIVISHSHYDHLDLASVRQIGSGPLWLVPLGLKKWLTDNGIAEASVVELDWWESWQTNGVTVTATPAQHWSARSLWDRNETLWASWMFQVGDFTAWYSGDTGYNPYQFKEIGSRFPAIDLALISIGAYEPRWFMKDMHINPAEAVQIHQDIGARYSLAVQWGTFPLTAEPIDDPPAKLRQALGEKNISPARFEILHIGEVKTITPEGEPEEE